MRIAHASIDEHNRISGGQIGNQTGKEVCIREWYNKPFTVLLRFPNEDVRRRIGDIAEALASDPLKKYAGYDQSNRNSMHSLMKECNNDYITFKRNIRNYECDCSSFATCVCILAGIKSLDYVGNAPTTSTMKSVFKKAGFEVITDTKVVGGTSFLSRGDILVKPGSHTVVVLDNGREYGKDITKNYFPMYIGKSTSIADALKSIGVDSSKSNRKKIYSANFSDEYRYTAKQNMAMLILIKEGKLIKP